MGARVEGTQRQTQFQPITSAETREGQGEAEDDEGRKDAPSVGAAIDGARQKKQNEKSKCAQTERNPSCQPLKNQAPIAVCSGIST